MSTTGVISVGQANLNFTLEKKLSQGNVIYIKDTESAG